ncbi:unnamed protein product [Blepharisma stoltei]|uniref:Uncharacterized protein n=1 Tax=Blepharisma stoltei TaxID=1481888 RepID=A0AAU9KJN2_9CILI|nr:unnamed protein product [Blepharisma stoltei]
MDFNRPIAENNKRLYNPHTGTLMEAIKKRKLNAGIENIMPSPGLIGPPQKDAVPWPLPPIPCMEIEKLVQEKKLAEQERQERINRATYQTSNCGPIREKIIPNS